MASYNLDSDCPPLFMGTNYFWWHEVMEFYVKHKDLDLWEIIKRGPIIIEKSKDQFTNDDYKMMSKNSKAINMLYCSLSIEICESIFYCKSAKEIWDTLCQLYSTNGKILDFDLVKQEETVEANKSEIYNAGDDNDSYREHSEVTNVNKEIQDVKDDGYSYGERIDQKQDQQGPECDSQELLALQNEKNEVNSLINYFSQSDLESTYLKTAIDKYVLKFPNCSNKIRKYVKKKPMRFLASLLSLATNHYGPNRKGVPIIWSRNLFLHKLTKTTQQLHGTFFIHPHRKIKQSPQAFKISRSSKRQNLVGGVQTEVIQLESNGLPKVKLR